MLAELLYTSAGGLVNAGVVFDKLAARPEIRCLPTPEASDGAGLHERVIENMVAFVSNRLGTKGTRHGEDQNIHDALLAAAVDGKMVADRQISAMANLFGVPWAAIKCAVVRRVTIDDEEIEREETSPSGMTPPSATSIASGFRGLGFSD